MSLRLLLGAILLGGALYVTWIAGGSRIVAALDHLTLEMPEGA